MRLIWIIIPLVLISTIGIQESFACSCATDPDYDQAIADADTAFQGTVLKIEEGSGFQKVHFMIHSVQKGDLEQGIFVMTNVNIYMDENKNVMLNSCDPEYEKGSTYQVIGWGSTEQNPVGETNMCSTRTIGSIIVELDDAFTAATFADKYKDMQFTGKRVSVVIKMAGESENSDPAKRAKEIRYLQSYVLKFLSFSNAVNVVSNPQKNEITAQIDTAWIPILEQRSDVISVTILEDQKTSTKHLNKLPPKKQTSQGIEPEAVTCKEELVLIIKHNGSPACVKPQTAEKLIQRGWTIGENKHLELENKSNKINGCTDVGGTWLDEHNECEFTGMTEEFENYCHDFNGEYDSCASGCRNYSYEPDQVCTTQCFTVCEFD